ncbi:hypothetical protein HN018_24040 (plasmid) [Lichenicola cladoniae]|uniref:Uncharacterized protein n=1 Tax=Lichenicola cladoniae TaxID=1484109 RepID=A0A6M8HYB9_9PROT|nr:hypothetical protein [Lichenicola cladoniae]QKE93246.1 hypothetical protein HN018_24040 [Lichenicola cladoniae]
MDGRSRQAMDAVIDRPAWGGRVRHQGYGRRRRMAQARVDDALSSGGDGCGMP